MEYFKLSNGVLIPAIGFGTGWLNLGYKNPKYLLKRHLIELVQKAKGEYSSEKNYTVDYELNKLRNFKKSLIDSLDIGYELYDTAYSYNNCDIMGAVLDKDEIRSKLFIISKCANSAQRNNTVREEFEQTLKALKTSYIDLYLIHWPQTNTYIDTWKTLEELYHSGKVRAIGVSNFHVHHLESIVNKCEVLPMVNEIECHPLLQQDVIRDYCQERGIRLVAHTATGKMRSGIRDSVLKDIAESHHKTIAQVILRWHYQVGDISIVNSLNAEHMKENLDCFGFVLSDEEMTHIGKMDCGFRIWPNPDTCDFTKL